MTMTDLTIEEQKVVPLAKRSEFTNANGINNLHAVIKAIKPTRESSMVISTAPGTPT